MSLKSIPSIFAVMVTVLLAEPIHRLDAILFCLKPEIDVMRINRQSSGITLSNPELDAYFQSMNGIDIEPWIPFATNMDFDGDIYLNKIYRVTLPEKYRSERDNILNNVKTLSPVLSAELEPIRKPTYTPNDPYYYQQWFLTQINANDAWDNWNISGGEIPGNESVLLASVDTGVDWDHVDLRNNLWQNLNEDADGDGHTIEYVGGEWVLDPGDLNGIDDDDWDNNSTTFVDDLIGWDLSGWSGTDDNNPIPKTGVSSYGTWAHGTHVAGLLAASTDNSTGIASTAFNCSIMSVKVSRENQTDGPYITEGYAGILYAAKAGYYAGTFAIINNSWGGGGYSSYEQANINVAHNTYNAVIFAAGGNGQDSYPYGEEYATHYPSSYENVISVAPIGTGNQWNHWATYHESIDLSSPGENIRSTVIGNNYTNWDGSSMATPIAASCVGLLKSAYPSMTNIQLETMILATADPVVYQVNQESYLQGRLGRGRVDAHMAIETGLFPQLEFVESDISIIGGSGSEIHPGDNVELRIIIHNNETWGDAVNITGTLTCDGENVLIQNNQAGFGSISPGGASLNAEEPFVLLFYDTVLEGEIDFSLELISNMNDYVQYSPELNFSLTVVENSETMIEITQDAGWNLVGLPVVVEDPYHMNIFPEAIEGTLYAYESAYIPSDDLTAGQGYWLRFGETSITNISGLIINENTVQLNEHWNLISGISFPVNINNILDPDNLIISGTLYDYTNGGYQACQVLAPGKAYWIRSNGIGTIILTQ